MVHCYLTGVQFPLDEGYVLNRREAHGLLVALKDRIASLQRIVDQLSPLDDVDTSRQRGRMPPARKSHRLVCKALAEALAPGYPEIRLFIPWRQYRVHARLTEFHSLRGHPRFGDAIDKLDDDELLRAADLGIAVLRVLDPCRELPHKARLAIKAATCIRHRTLRAPDLLRLMRDAMAGAEAHEVLGLTEDELESLSVVPGDRSVADSPD